MSNVQTTEAGGDLALGIMFGVIFVPIFVGLALGIMLPLMGGMIRYRADYQPRGALRSEMSRHAPAATSFFGSLRRVKALEGWYGLYKGSYPLLGMMAISSPFIVLLAVFNGQAKGPTQTATLASAVIFTLISIALLPLQVIFMRCIVTPYRLSSCASLSEKMQLILSPAEFNSPMRLYATPGLLPLTIVASVFTFILTWAARSLILGPAVENGNTGDLPLRIIIFLVFRLVATLWLTPLDVLSIRLALLPASDERGAAGIDKGTNNNEIEGEVTALLDTAAARCSSHATEDVVRRRYEAPYTGTIDCVRRVSDEEGVRALYRGWIWTCLGSVLGVMG